MISSSAQHPGMSYISVLARRLSRLTSSLRFTVAFVVFLATSQTDAFAQVCNSGLDTSATVIRDGSNRPVGAVITNNSTSCSHLVGVATYKVISDLPQDHIESQVIFDAREQILGPGETVNWTLQIPECAYQIDAFRGPLLQTFRGGARYSGRKFFAFLENMTNLCAPPTCEEAKVRDIVGRIIPAEGEDPSCGRLINYSSECVYPVGVASYSMFDIANLDTQVLFDANLAQLAPLSQVELCVDRPVCAYQLDVFEGALITQFSSVERYGSRLRDAGNYVSDGRPLCAPPTPTPTPSPTPTATATPTITPTPTPTTTPLPALECAATGPETNVACPVVGATVSANLSGVGSSTGSSFSYSWSTSCPGGSISSPDSLLTSISVPMTQLVGTSVSCSSTLTVRREADGATVSCPVPLQFSGCPTDCEGTINGGALVDRCGVCSGDGNSCILNCSGQQLRDRQILIDNLAAELRARVARIFRLSAKVERSNAERRARIRAVSDANAAYLTAWRTGWSLPSVVLTCTNAAVCSQSSLASKVDTYRTNVAKLLKLGDVGAKRLRARQSPRLRSEIRREFRRLVNVHKSAVESAAQLPAANFICP